MVLACDVQFRRACELVAICTLDARDSPAALGSIIGSYEGGPHKMKNKIALWVFGLSLIWAAPAFATGTTIDFGSPTTISGDTATFTFDSHTITAMGFECTD